MNRWEAVRLAREEMQGRASHIPVHSADMTAGGRRQEESEPLGLACASEKLQCPPL